jgi:predicted PurR-regulated permease PerM
MNTPNHESSRQQNSRQVEVLIRVALIGGMAALCYRVFAPFLTLTVWAIILAVAMYPLHQMMARKMGGRQGLAATLIVIAGSILIITPTAMLMVSFGESIRSLIHNVQEGTLVIPAPKASIESWPLVGEKLHRLWSMAYTDLPGLLQSMQPKLSNLTKSALEMVASIGGAILGFLIAFLLAGVLMAYGESGKRVSLKIFNRIVGIERGEAFAKLSTATVRAVAQGVVGVALIQSILIGIALLVAGIPGAGVLAAIALVICIAQVPALIVTLPAVVYIWWSGDYSTGAAITYTVILLLAGIIDNVLKPLMLGRGVDAPMPVILLGALGGMVSAGILGMFVGATLLAVSYQIFMGWIAPEELAAQSDSLP